MQASIHFISRQSSKITNETSIFLVKNMEGGVKNFGTETPSESRGSRAIKVLFCFIPISQLVAKIQGLEVCKRL